MTPDHACFLLFFFFFLHDSKGWGSWTLVTTPFPPPLPPRVGGVGGGECGPPKKKQNIKRVHTTTQLQLLFYQIR